MQQGKEFEVSKDVYERALTRGGYMCEEDRQELFPVSILWGYGLYDCRVREKDGKYICSYKTGDSCD